MAASLIRKTAVIWWMLVLSGMVISCSSPVRLDRRWDWGCAEKTGCRYAFGIRPDGTGKFYDFSVSDDGRAKPSQIFECRLSP